MVPRIKTPEPSAERVGIDISEEKFDACLRYKDGKPKAHFKLNGQGMDQFRQWLKRHGIVSPELWMEATGRYFEKLAEWAIKLGWKAVVINPRAARYFAISKLKMNKTDPLDAEVILRFAESSDQDEFNYWMPRSAARKELRDLQVAITGLKKEIGQERNRLKCGLISECVKATIRQTIDYLKGQVKKLHKESMRVIKADPDLGAFHACLKRIKGFGDVTIALVLWKIDFHAFRKGRQLVKFAGLDSAEWSSGKSVKRKAHISRVGHAELRSALFLPAVAAMTHDSEMKAFAEKLIARGACKKVAICAVMARLLRISFALVRDQREGTLAIAA